mmetsp:Transcript_24013/g.69006  ORF Transcript_24013/g.69006 Transcript_24013/m.69006 type:complete len:116 (+) Transcript_24013:52-399(+)
MKLVNTFFAFLLTSVSHAFVERSSAAARPSMALGGGFLNGSEKKSDLMQREDDAMWVEDPNDEKSSAGGGGFWNPFAIAKNLDDPKSNKKTPAQRAPQPPLKPKKSNGFKFPWDK